MLTVSLLNPSRLCPALYDELRQFRSACADAHMKSILAVGDLDSFTTVYKASLVAMMAGRSHDSLSLCVLLL